MNRAWPLSASLGVVTLWTGLAHATCVQTDAKEVRLVDKSATRLKVEACMGEGATHRLTVRLLEGDRLVHAETLDVEGRSYVLSVSTDLDLDQDGTADVAVSTGRGRAADGMRYWLLKRTPTRLIEVGEALQLAWSTGSPRRLFALVPGGAEVQATRVEYSVVRRRLVPVRSLQFVPLDSGGYEVRVLEPRSSVAAPRGGTRVPEADAQQCMDGGACRW